MQAAATSGKPDGHEANLSQYQGWLTAKLYPHPYELQDKDGLENH